MTDPEIRKYLDDNHWSVDAQDCISKVFNTSYQITDTIYNSDKNMMTIVTHDNKFTFRWNLKHYN